MVRHALIANSTSPAALALVRGFPWLRFEPQLEQEYYNEHYAAIQPRVRVAVFLALLTVLGFAALDHWVLAGGPGQLHDSARFVLHFPIVVICLILTSKRFFPKYYLPAISVAAPLFGIGSVLLAIQTSELHLALMSARLVLVVFFFYFMLGMPFRMALAANLIVFGAFAIAALQGAIPAGSAIYILFVIFCANLFAGAGSYALEHANRLAFLERRLLNEFATHDGLTGLLNRGALEAAMQQSWAEAARRGSGIGVIMLDIDHFKAYNDRYGHQGGDLCLRNVAQAVRRAARRATDLVGRYGGEEMILVVPDADELQLRQLAAEILSEVRQLALPHEASLTAPYVTVSIGIAALADAAQESFEATVKRADAALYQAKAAGRNRAVLAEPPEAPASATIVRLATAQGRVQGRR